MSSPRPRLDSLTSLRFLAAFFVVAFHARSRMLAPLLAGAPAWADNILATGYVSVGFFFVLSGFILAYNYGSKPELDRRSFWSARFARIYPVFLLGLSLGAIPAFVEFRHQEPLAQALRTFAWTGALNLTMLNAFSAQAGVWNAPAWSLSAEAFFYLLFPWLIAPMFRLSRRQLKLACVALACIGPLLPALWCALDPELAAWRANVPSIGPSATQPIGGSAMRELWIQWIGYSPIGRLPEFVLGIAIGRLHLTRSVPLPEAASSRALPVACAVAGLAILSMSPSIPHLVLGNGLLDALFALIIYQLARLAAADATSRPGLLSHRWLVLLGESSYALYILHVPARDWALALNKHVGLPGPLLFAVYASSMTLLSILVLKRVERPWRTRLLDWLNKPDRLTRSPLNATIED